MSMTIGDLVRMVEEVTGGRFEYGEDESRMNIEVRLAHQPRWAFEYSISDEWVLAKDEDGPSPRCCGDHNEERCNPESALAPCCEDCISHENEEEPDEQIVYIAESRQIGYLPGAIARKLGWS